VARIITINGIVNPPNGPLVIDYTYDGNTQMIEFTDKDTAISRANELTPQGEGALCEALRKQMETDPQLNSINAMINQSYTIQ
jgi:hypothetical protein